MLSVVALFLGDDVRQIMVGLFFLVLEGVLKAILIFTMRWVVLICGGHELLLDHDLAVRTDLLLEIVIGLFDLTS